MVNLNRIREDLRNQLETDSSLHSVEVRADTLDEALADAAVQLETKVANLEYEIIERGSNGFLGLAKKIWVVRVYQNPDTVKKVIAKQADMPESVHEELGHTEEVNRDGVFYIHNFGSNVYLKVVPPVGSGSLVQLNDVLLALKRPDIKSLDEAAVATCVEKGTDGEYAEVAIFDHNASADATFVIEISPDEMEASIIATSPYPQGAEISAEAITAALQTQGVVVGVDTDKIAAFVDSPVYNVPYVVAEGVKPVDGRDAYIAYNFETDRSKLRVKEAANGQVNFKELNLIQNVVKGQPLAQKMPAERGKNGKTLFGKFLESKNGKDIPLPLGKNVSVDIDGSTIIADTNGQVLLVGNKINVEPIMEVDGVSIKTGNIKFLGTVIVKGNVDDGFEIKASGNIEVYGTVGSCKLEADGDIIVSLGIMGRDTGTITAGKSLWAKFIQNTSVEVKEFVIVTDSIVNSHVIANRKILLQGKRAQIIGGHLFATEEIVAKAIGSMGGGSETILEVGYDPLAKRQLDQQVETQTVLVKELDEVEVNIQTLENNKKIRRVLSQEKEESLLQLQTRKNEILDENEKLTNSIHELQKYLRDLKVIGRVSASGTVYAGVKIFVRDVKDEIRTDVKNVTFYYENGFVRRGKYEAPNLEDVKRVPDGYSTN